MDNERIGTTVLRIHQMSMINHMFDNSCQADKRSTRAFHPAITAPKQSAFPRYLNMCIIKPSPKISSFTQDTNTQYLR